MAVFDHDHDHDPGARKFGIRTLFILGVGSARARGRAAAVHRLVRARLTFLLKASRPGLWFPTIWLYALPLAGTGTWASPWAWVGLLWVTFPLNLLTYGWNDLVDRETDRLNPRKDTWLFGARGTDAQLAGLPRAIVAVQVVTWPALLWRGGLPMLAVLGGMVGFMAIYNHPTRGWRARPPLELLAQVGYLLVVLFAVRLNGVAAPPAWTFAYLVLFCAQAQLMGEVMDVEPDRAAGRRTTATVLGVGTTKLLIIAVVGAEVTLLCGVFGDLLFGGMMVGALLWLLVDRFVVFGEGGYTLFQMKLFGVGSNVLALLTLAYVGWTGSLLHLDGPWVF